jgi:hypothetical protein
MYRAPTIAVLLAAAAFPLSLAGQMRAIQRPSGPVQVNISRFRVPPPSGRLGVTGPRSFGRRASFVRPGLFRRNSRFSISFGNTCFTSPFFDPILCEQLLSGNQFLFSQPVFLPFAGYTGPYYQAAEQNALAVVDREGDLAREVDRLTNEVELLRTPQPAPEPLLLEWHGDHWVRVTSFGQSATGAQPAYSKRIAWAVHSIRAEQCTPVASRASTRCVGVSRWAQGRSEQLHHRGRNHVHESELLD